MRRAGTPAISAKAGTSRVTTAPAAMKQYSPSVWPQTMVALAPIVAPRFTSVCAELVLALDLGARIVDVGEDAGRAAEHAILQLDAVVEQTLFWILQLSPTVTSGPIMTFWPIEQFSPIVDALQHVAEMPDARALADLRVGSST